MESLRTGLLVIMTAFAFVIRCSSTGWKNWKTREDNLTMFIEEVSVIVFDGETLETRRIKNDYETLRALVGCDTIQGLTGTQLGRDYGLDIYLDDNGKIGEESPIYAVSSSMTTKRLLIPSWVAWLSPVMTMMATPGVVPGTTWTC